MTIEVCIDAYGKIRKAGVLRRHSGAGRERVTYEHDADWLESPEAFQFDPTLPLRRGSLHPGANNVMFGTLGDSAPDTWGRSLMRRRERRAAELEGRQARTLHETDYLLGVSDETRRGAIRFCVEGVFQSPQANGVPPTIALGDLLLAAQRIERGEESDEDLTMIFAPGSTLGGARPKASVYDQHGNLSIAKFPKERDGYSMERWEAIAMDMAQAAGIEVAEHQLVRAAGHTVFMSRRFDRIHSHSEDDQRIPFMSAMAVTEHNDGDDTCSYLEILEAINTRGSVPERDRAELFRRMAFTILISNTDDHFRNHGFLWSGKKGWQLSPAYDLNPTPNSARVLSARIDYDDASASIELLRSVAEFFVSMKDADGIIKDCRDVVKKWRDYAHARSAPAAEVKQMQSAFEHEEMSV
ncbi:MAG: serine/threonine-protein kinase HipA [Granulosicoccus sp.]|jgi:serine/threonine-protein kinase HipA